MEPNTIKTMKTNNRIRTRLSVLAVALVSSGIGGFAQAALIDLGPGSFTPAATAITFSEAGYPINTTDPVYSFTGLPGLGNVMVSFGGLFVGQTVTNTNPNTLLNNLPTGPLTLAGGPPTTFITTDGANPTSPVLSGTPRFNGVISVLFSVPVAGVGLDGGYFDAIGGTSIEAYGADGSSLGIVHNTQYGIEFFGLADSGGANVIKGISFYITGSEPAGFAIDNLTFGAKEVINDVPDGGSTLIALSLASLWLEGLRRLRRR